MQQVCPIVATSEEPANPDCPTKMLQTPFRIGSPEKQDTPVGGKESEIPQPSHEIRESAHHRHLQLWSLNQLSECPVMEGW